MQCPFCHNTGTTVSYTRQQKNRVKRKRSCSKCDNVFFTHETVTLSQAHIIKKDGRKEVFEEDKLQKSLLAASLKRPKIQKEIPNLVLKTKKFIFSQRKRAVPSKDVASFILSELKSIDPIAYLRFASVQDPAQLENMLLSNEIPITPKVRKNDFAGLI